MEDFFYFLFIFPHSTNFDCFFLLIFLGLMFGDSAYGKINWYQNFLKTIKKMLTFLQFSSSSNMRQDVFQSTQMIS
jgi:hypothetical protein